MKSTSRIRPLDREELKRIRKRTGKSLAEFAPLLGMTGQGARRTVRRFESGKELPRDSVLERYHALREGKL